MTNQLFLIGCPHCHQAFAYVGWLRLHLRYCHTDRPILRTSYISLLKSHSRLYHPHPNLSEVRN